MHALRKQRLIIYTAMVLCLGVALALVLYALQEKVDFFYTPTELQAKKAELQHKSVRLGGLVKPGSVSRSEHLLYFTVMDQNEEVLVAYAGIIPDLFREGKGVVAEGYLNPYTEESSAVFTAAFTATKVLAKHDENYMPPAIRHKLAE